MTHPIKVGDRVIVVAKKSNASKRLDGTICTIEEVHSHYYKVKEEDTSQGDAGLWKNEVKVVPEDYTPY